MRRRELALAAVAATAFYVGTHVSALPPRVLAPADNLRRFAPFNDATPAGEPAQVQNPLLLDPLLQFIPWQEHSRRELSAGRLPLWNPNQGLGTVHLGNDQSAVFSLWSLPYYLLGPYGLFLAGLGKTLALVLGVFLFLRKQGLAPRPALVGGLAAAACGPVIAWQLHPHTGAFAWVGFLLLAVEETVSGQRPWRWSLALALVTALTLLAGHLQTAFLMALLAAVWMLVNAAGRGWPAGGRAVARAAGAVTLGLGLAAVHILPFLEALEHSTEVLQREAGTATATAPLSSLTLCLFPDLFGSPRDGFVSGPFAGGPGYLELAPAYGGCAVLLLGVLGLCGGSWRGGSRRCVRTFSLVTLVSLGVVLGPLARVLALVPPFDVTRNHRFVFLAALGIVMVGAAGLDHLLRERRRGNLKPELVLWGGVGLFLAAILVLALGGHLADPWRAGPAGRPLRGLLLAVAVPLASGLGVLALLRSRQPARWVATGLGIVICVELLVFGADFAPGAEREALRPPLPELERRAPHRILTVGKRVLAPNLATSYGLRATRVYDGLGNANLEPQWESLAPFEGPLMGTLSFDDSTADRLGIRYVLTDDPHLARNLERGLGNWHAESQSLGSPQATLGRDGAGQTLLLGQPTAAVALPEVQCDRPTELILRIHEGERLLREARVALPRGKTEALFRFEPLAPRENLLRLSLRSRPPGARVLYSAQDRVKGTRLERGQTAPGDLTFLLADRTSVPYRLVPTSWERTWLLENPDPQPRARLLDTRGNAEIIVERPGDLEVQVSGDGPSRLRLTQAWAPGWRAEQDGQAIPVRSADGLLEVDAPSGTSTVRFRYDPPSVRRGGVISVLCVLVFLGLSLLVSVKRS